MTNYVVGDVGDERCERVRVARDGDEVDCPGPVIFLSQTVRPPPWQIYV